jgi:riboflavin kinase/FMN adenylyltransferase
MDVVHGSASLTRSLDHPVLTIGNFDGLHLGHRSIIDTVVEQANALGGEPVVYTFDPHPRAVLFPERAPKRLVTLEQKLELFEAEGISMVIVEPFTLEFSRTSPEQFVREYVQRAIAPRKVYLGYDFHFGKDREGSMRLFTELGPELGFEVTIIPEVKIGDRDVNSTRIRALLEEGQVEEATHLLGRPYSIRGDVVHGEGRGATLGFPTANIDTENEILPGTGVYAGHFHVLGEEGKTYRTVINVGCRPTFHKQGELSVEAHLLDFTGDLYGVRGDLSFENWIRAEQRFPGKEALQAQIQQDIASARQVLGSVD